MRKRECHIKCFRSHESRCVIIDFSYKWAKTSKKEERSKSQDRKQENRFQSASQ